MKHLIALSAWILFIVAPRAGAWIETVSDGDTLSDEQSHPVRVRGLKHRDGFDLSHRNWSHPVRVRGLKLLIKIFCKLVTPVAPRAGAWIETIHWWHQTSHAEVAPRAGAWIETTTNCRHPLPTPSHPVRVRGLKHKPTRKFSRRNPESHPVRVRGLKLTKKIIQKTWV